jgi:F-type H+-transporting ATPase subunit a
MGNLSEFLMEELNVATAFTIPIFGGIEVAESTVISWVIMAIIVILTLVLTRNMKVENPGKLQVGVEYVVESLQNIVRGIVGHEGEHYVPYLATVLVFLGISNVFAVTGMKPPTKDLNVSAAVALMSIVLVQIASIRQNRVKGWLKGFTKPIAVVTPINIMELAIRPLSLCMRLFGNVLGAFVVMKLLEHLVPIILPAVFSLYFDFFDGLIQAYVFVFLTGLFIKEAVED